MTGLRIDPLTDVVQHTATVMTWIFNQFGAAPGRTLPEVIAGAAHYANTRRLPMLFVASRDDQPLGCVVLREHDLAGHEQLTPWLASLYVTPAARGQGIAAALSRHIETVAAGLGYAQLYLHTPDAVAYYERLGWSQWSRGERDGEQTVVMCKRLTAANLA